MFERLIIVVLAILALCIGIIAVVLVGIVAVIGTVLFVIAEFISWVLNGFIWLWNTIFDKDAEYFSCCWFLP